MPKDSLLVYSGGLDSTVLLYEQAGDIDTCLFFEYGARGRLQEFGCATKHTYRLGVGLEIINLENIFSHVSGSLLTHSTESVPAGRMEEAVGSIIVPFRNAIFLSIGVAVAESRGLKRVLIGAHTGQPPILPDCSSEFMGLMRLAGIAGTAAGVNIDTPFMHLTKHEIVVRGVELGVNFNDTWSCYTGGHAHCGVCKACVERREALLGIDPTEYVE